MKVLFDSDAVKTIKTALGGERKVFDTYADATSVLESIALKMDELKQETDILFAGDDQNPPEDWTTPVCVSILGTRGEYEGKNKEGVKALVVFPMPTVDDFLSEAPDWIAKLVQKEAAHVAFRQLRNAESDAALQAAAIKMPMTIEAYITEHASRGGIDTECFDTMWKDFRAAFVEQYAQLKAFLPGKSDVLTAIRSKTFAETEYGKLESLHVFEAIAKGMIEQAPDWEPALDPTAIQEWLDRRDTWQPASRTAPDESLLDGLDLGLGD